MSAQPTPAGPLPEDFFQLVKAVTTSMRDLFFGLSREGMVRYVSVNAETLIGFSHAELLGSDFFERVDPGDVALAASMLARILLEETRLTFQIRLRSKTGSVSWWEVFGNPYTALAGEKRVFFVARDITEKLHAEMALADSEKTIRRLYEIGASSRTDVADKMQAILQFGCERFKVPSGVLWRHDGDAFATIGRFDAAASDSTTLPADAEMRLARAVWVGSETTTASFGAPSFVGAVVRLRGEPWGALVFADSADRPTAFSSPELDAMSLMAMLAGSHIERGEAETELQRLALTDPLTGLPNRRLLDDRIKALLKMCRRFRTTCALLFVDLDHFKEINDRFGHHAGDAALVEVTHRLGAQLRSVDTLARIGGDEFVVLMPQTEARGAKVVADRILHSLRRPLTVGHSKATISASIGVAEHAHGIETPEKLIARADTAMYSVKTAGRNGIALSA
jgi:diguanylate cyclase (GGDEF)-like protein/PAS domain S-box-containing protein